MAEDLDGNALARMLRPYVGLVTIEDLTRLPGGASKQTWSFDAVGADGTRTELVLRRDQPGRPADPSATRREAKAIGLASEAGLPVPELLATPEAVAGEPGSGMIMRRVPGETIARKILRDQQYAPARGRLVSQLAQFAAGLHALPAPAGFPAPDPLAAVREQLDSFGRPSEVFELAMTELAASRPIAARACPAAW